MAQEKPDRGAKKKKWPEVKPFKLRVKIVAASHLREVTPREIAKEEGLAPATVQYHFRALETDGWIHVCREEQVRGGIRHYYTADRLKWVKQEEFEQMSDEERFETSEAVLMHYLDICGQALKEKTLDARPDSHLSHTPMHLDQKGWDDMQREADRWLERSLEIRVEAAMRIRESGEKSSPTLVHIGAFEIPASVMEETKAHH